MKKVAFTIVLNGMDFLEQQKEIITRNFDKWYIVEGAANPCLDTKWCKKIPDDYHKNGLSIDGTTEYLDKIKLENPEKIEVIRNANGFWNGKTEMCNSFMENIENCILMQIDVDEFWNDKILKEIFDFCEGNDGKFNGMYFKCNFFVGKDMILDGENNYSDHYWEWLRLWVAKEKTKFLTHEPPCIKGLSNILSKKETKQKGWIFNHYAYTNEKQLRFKEKYYGYGNAYEQWKKLQDVKEFPVKLKDYFSWVDDEAKVVKI